MACCDNRIRNLEKDDSDEFCTIVASGTLCCSKHDEIDDKMDEKGTSQPQLRRCTDIGCLVLLIIMIICDVVILGIALSKKANPEHLWKGHGYDGEICGDDERTAWVNINYPKITECVSSCDAVTAYNSTPFEHYWCVPDKDARENKAFTFDEGSATYTRTVADLYTMWRLVLTVSLSGSIIISLIYLYMISINQRLLSYVIMNIGFGLIAGILLIIHGYQDWKSDLTDNTGIIEIVFGAFILGLVVMIGAWFHFDREALKTEIEMIAEAIQAIEDNWSIIIFCIIYCIFIMGFFVYWVVSALFIYSVPDLKTYSIPDALKDKISDTDKYRLFDTADYKYSLIYHIIFAFYILFVFCYFGYLVVSHVILVWYLGKRAPFTCCCCNPNQDTDDEKEEEDEDDKQDKKSRRFQRICEAFGTIILYHIGTASFAALFLFFLSDIPTAFKKWLYPFCKDTKCCKQRKQTNNDGNNNNNEKGDTEDGQTTHTIEMSKIEHEKKIRKKLIYDDIKEEVFPLIEEKIQNLSIEYAISEAIDKKMESITCKHYYIPKQNQGGPVNNDKNNVDSQYDDGKEEEKNQEDNNDVDHNNNNEEQKHVNNYDANNDNDVDNNDTNTEKKEKKEKKEDTVNILDIIKDNITKFNYEESIKKDIEEAIEQKYKTLNKEVKIKKEIYGIQDELQQNMENKKPATNGIAYKYDKIRKEGLIFTSLHGTSLCYSSYRASKLERQNITRLANVEGFSQYNERFGRIGIVSVNTAIAVIWMFILDSLYDNISSFIMPSFIVFMVSYTIGYIFTMMLEVTVSTLLFCVILNEKQWNKRFTINQGKIKQNVTKLGNGLAAMLSEHLLIMQLKETEVNEKISEKEIKKYVEKKDKNLADHEKRRKVKILKNRLFDAKKDALTTERALLEEIDGAMKLTEYLINVILVENLFNKRYKYIKPNQEIARRDHADDIFDEEKYDEQSSKAIKKKLYNKVKKEKKIENFLDFYPIPDKKEDEKVSEQQKEETVLETEWKIVIKNLEAKLKENGIKNVKMTGAKQKGIERAFYKSFYSYHDKNDGFRYLTDMLRCSFVFDDFENLYKCFKEIYSMKEEFEILRVKDRFNTTSEPCGYRDFMMNVVVKNNESIKGIICEIQLHHKQFYNAKKISHKMYKKTRLFEKDDGNEAYKYAVKYIRPVIGRFKIYPIDDEEIEQIDILKIIGKKIEKLGSEYYQQHIKPILDSNKFVINYDKSKMAHGRRSIILPPSNERVHIMQTPPEHQQFD